MAARRNKSQARRTSGGGAGAMPGWAWLVIGVLATLLLFAALVLAGMVSAPKFLSSSGDGFFRPQPNPDAQPEPVDADGEAIVPEGLADEGDPQQAREPASGKAGAARDTDADYDFYTLLPGKEVPMTEAEIAATAQVEARRAEQARAAQQAAAVAAGGATPGAMPSPVRDEAAARAPVETPVASATTTASTSTAPSEPARPVAAPVTAAATTVAATPPAPIGDDTRYLLQAGAFQASGQAEELKAKIALLGLGARVESARIQGKTVYRVRMGPYGTASDLSDAKRKLAAGGVPGMAIKVD